MVYSTRENVRGYSECFAGGSFIKMCGNRDTASLLIYSYSSDRDQYVVCDDYKSNVLPANVGVPQ